MNIRIENAEYVGPSTKSITLDLHGKSCKGFLERLQAPDAYAIDGLDDVIFVDPDGASIVWQDMGLGIEQGEGFVRINVWCHCTAEGEDRLDGTVEPVELSLDDILAVSGAIKSIMRHLG